MKAIPVPGGDLDNAPLLGMGGVYQGPGHEVGLGFVLEGACVCAWHNRWFAKAVATNKDCAGNFECQHFGEIHRVYTGVPLHTQS